MGGKGLTPFLLASLLLLLISCAASRRDYSVNPRYRPAEDLLQILTDFQRYLDADTYRFEPPKDITGKNIYKATLARLDSYQKTYPNYLLPIVYFSRAKALEKLHDYQGAIRNYRFLLKVKDRLSEKARENMAICQEFLRLKSWLQEADGTQGPSDRLERLEQARQRWKGLIEKYQGTPYEYLAREEEERLAMIRVRWLMEQGAEEAQIIKAFQELIDEHQSSKYIHQHWLSLANFYFSRAKEYATLYNPEGLEFDPDVFSQYVRAAAEIYARVANEHYGRWERVEAQAYLEALQSFARRILSLNQ